MNILIAPSVFKGSLSARQAAQCIVQGLRKSKLRAKFRVIPLADGGKGTVESFISSSQSRIVRCSATGPLGKRIKSYFGFISGRKTAVIEMCAASGFDLVPSHKRNPLKTTTYGTGELIRQALNRGCRKIIVGIGDSATVDGGVGMAQALGIRFLDASGKDIGRGGGQLIRLAKIDFGHLDKRIKKTTIIVASDVKNPLLGKNGAAYVYGPQKGATPVMVRQLEKGMNNLVRIIQQQVGININKIPGSGAAGGLGAGLVAFLGARMVSGVDLIIKQTRLETHLRKSDLAITGEGQLDRKTIYGKTIMGVVNLARKHRVPVICLAGSISPEAEVLYKRGVIGLFSITPRRMPLERALKKARTLLTNTAENLGDLLKPLTK